MRAIPYKEDLRINKITQNESIKISSKDKTVTQELVDALTLDSFSFKNLRNENISHFLDSMKNKFLNKQI
jgi:hypothetical protein